MPTHQNALNQMLSRYPLESIQDSKNAIKEIVQEITLLGLWRAKFFEKAAFYGGTALRILHDLDRFSEDLDFTLLKPDPQFDLARYEQAVQDELTSWGFTATVEKKKKRKQSAVDSAFIKLNTVQHLLLIGVPIDASPNLHPDEMLKVRFEVDTDPPPNGGSPESQLLLMPTPFSIKTLKLEDLFAGKVHATLCREWKGRVKGRDWYDLIWFVSRQVPLNVAALESRMRQSGHWNTKLTKEDVLTLFEKRISSLDIPSAKEDIINFVKDSSAIDIWDQHFFRQVAEKMRFI